MKDLTEGSEGRNIFHFAIPMWVGHMFQQLYTFVDQIIVGRFLGKEALASVGASFPVIFTLSALIILMEIQISCKDNGRSSDYYKIKMQMKIKNY